MDGGRRQRGGRGGANGVSRGAGRCRYMKGEWSECDATTNTRTRTLTLKPTGRNSPDCEPTKVQTKRCPRTDRPNRRGDRQRQ
jgi:hypothetical protein